MSESQIGQTHVSGLEGAPVDQRRILRFFTPLAVSWIFMSLEGPITSGFITRSAGEENGLAAMGVLMPLAILIESPVIDLLSTSTTICKTHASYLQLRNFTAMLMLWTALAHAAVTLSPFYWTVVEVWIGAPHEVAVVLRPAMAIMVPWAAFVGWRRFHHGILIRYDNTRPIGIGTTVRVLSVFLVGSALYYFTNLPGITLAAFALVGSVFTEAVFIHFVARPIIRERLDPMAGGPTDQAIGYRKLASFHFPLTAATLAQIFSMPLVSWALAHSPEGKSALAAWGLAMSVVFLFRSITFALPETVIALYRDEQSRRELGRFCVRVGVVCSIAIVVVTASGAAHWFFQTVLNSKRDVAAAATYALVVSVLMPAVNAYGSHLRGLLTAHHRTRPRLYAIVAAVAALCIALVVGVKVQANGLTVIGIGMTIQVLAETAVLAVFWRSETPDMGAIQ